MATTGLAFAEETMEVSNNASLETISYSNTSDRFNWSLVVTEDDLKNYSRIAAQICDASIARINIGSNCETLPGLNIEEMAFYVSLPLITKAGSIGTLTVMDNHPKTLSRRQQSALKALIDQICETFAARQKNEELLTLSKELESLHVWRRMT